MSIFSRNSGAVAGGRLWLPDEERPDTWVDSMRTVALDFQTVMASLAPLPRHTGLLGICEDGLPLLMDLSNPSPGSVLVLGDQLAANRSLLRVMLASLVWPEMPADLEVEVITPEPQTYAELGVVPGFLRLTDPGETAVCERVWAFVTAANQRSARPGRTVQLLIIDDLEALLSQVDVETLDGLKWLVTFGPEVGTWVFASFDARQFRQIDDQIVQAFGTRLVGYLPSLKFSEVFSGLPPDVPAALEPGVQYCAKIAGELVRFWLPSDTNFHFGRGG